MNARTGGLNRREGWVPPPSKRWEGWFTDPFERHEARWMSQGTPTALVRDGNIEGSDPVASGPFIVNPVRVGGHPAEFGSELNCTRPNSE
jgi:hypothetical protein